MFENIVGQSASEALTRDISGNCLAPSMLFEGPPASGKGTAALELGRIISCENTQGRKAAWNCSCPACERHRRLLHPDLLCLGSKPFSAEIAASSAAFLQETESAGARTFFIRAVRKLLLRFSPALWEDEPKISKLNPLISSLEEELDEFETLKISGKDAVNDKLKKLLADVLKDSIKLESDGIAETVPISQIRHASWWVRLAPSGKGKLLLIENADRMLDSARNSLLKLLEEPPGNVSVVLTSSRPGTLLPTILSRLRPYRFEARSEETEKEVIRKVFRNKDTVTVKQGDMRTSLISAYLDSFLPVPGAAIEGLAAFFAASTAMRAALLRRKKGGDLPEAVVLLGKYTAPIAEAAGLGRPLAECAQVSAKLIKGAENFEIRSLFQTFLRSLLTMVSASQKQAPSPSCIPYNELWRECTARAESAVLIYNQTVSLALEMLFTALSRGMADLG